MNRFGKRILLCLLAALVLGSTACGAVRTDRLEKLEPAGQQDADSQKEDTEPLKEKNELPADGIIAKAQLETIAGKDGTYEFYATDPDTSIQYIWSYDGSKIQNAVEQRLKVSFPSDGLDEIKKKANNATVGLGVALDKMELAAPATLKLILPEKWEADAVILCKLVENEPAQMAEVEIGVEKDADDETTCLTFPVLEAGDTYYLVGGLSQPAGSTAASENSSENPSKNSGVQTAGSTAAPENGSENPGKNNGGQTADGNGGQAGANIPSRGDTPEPETRHLCTISIDCITLAQSMSKLREPEKAPFVPQDGWLLYPSEVEFTPGETVYDILYRVCQQAGYQMEASYTPIYGSYYIEGINNLYEFDGGELSGWMYSVNGWYPNYGCSSYTVSNGDVIKWRYTLDLGRDVGGHYAMGE